MAPSAPKPATGRYEQYKRDTSLVISWLVKTASECTDLMSLPTEVGSPRQPGPRSHVTTNTRTLVELARIITSPSAQEMNVEVPDVIVSLLGNVIQRRQQFADWFAGHETDDSKGSNNTHQYFIASLRHVYDLLASVARPAADNGKSNNVTSTQRASVVNLFTHLDIEEPTADPLGEEPTVTIGQGITSTRATVALKQDQFNDKHFALWCFLHDAKEIQELILATWRDYAKGDVSLVAASMTLEFGFSLLRQHLAQQPDLKEWDRLPVLLGLDIRTFQHVTYVSPAPKLKPVTRLEVPSIKASSLLCCASAQNLKHLRMAIFSYWESPEGRKARLTRKYSMITGVWYKSQYSFRELMMDSVPEMCALMTEYERGVCECCGRVQRTEFLKGVMNYCLSGVLPVWLVVAYEIYSGIYETIGSSPECAGEGYLSGVSRIEGMLGDYREFLRTSPIGHIRPGRADWTSDMDDAFKKKQAAEGVLRTDAHHEAPKSNEPVPIGLPVRTLAGLPCVTGYRLYTCQNAFHQASVPIAEDCMLVLSYAHLYTALRRYGLMKTIWHDMDFVIKPPGSMQPFITKASHTDAFSLLKCFLLDLGTPLTAFAHGKVPGLPPMDTALKLAKRPQVTNEFVKAILKRRRQEERVGIERGELLPAVLAVLADTAERASGKNRPHVKPEDYSPADLLATFKKVLLPDEPHLNFNYLGFWVLCEDVNRRLALDPKLRGWFHAIKKEDRLGMPHETVYHLLELSISAKGKVMIDDDEYPLNVATRALEAALEGRTNKFSHDAFSQSSGRIPRDLRPKLVPYDKEQMISAAAAILSQDPSAEVVKSASHELVFDPNGSLDRFNQAKKTVKQLKAVQRDNPMDSWSEHFARESPWTFADCLSEHESDWEDI